jgi:hypothetical protein
MSRWLVASIGMVTVLACHKRARAELASSSAPAVSSISPVTGPAGASYPIELTISGHNFADSTNTVTFGPVTLKAVRSTNAGTRIVVYAPKELPSTGEAPPMPLVPGSYTVRVATAAGTSNAVTFTLGREP